MVETLNKRIIPTLEREARANARRYWERKAGLFEAIRTFARAAAKPNPYTPPPAS